MAQSQATSSGNNSKMATLFFNTDVREIHEFSDDVNIADVIFHASDVTPCKINDMTCMNRKRIHSKDRECADSVEHKDALYIKMEMPGFAKEDVSITVDKGVMTIKADKLETGSSTGEKKKPGWRFKSYFHPVRVYKIHDIKAVVKNGLLKVVVPRDENKQDAFMGFLQVQLN